MTLRNGLVAEYHFSGNANDSSGNGNDGTVTGATLTTDKNGTPNQAYDFDGNGDYITINDNSDTFDMSSTKSLTFNTWLKMPNGQTGISNVVDKRTTSFRSGWQLFLRQENQSGDGAFSLASATSSNVGRVIIPKSAITYGQWQMITCIYDHTIGTYGQVKVYLNGVLFDVSNATAHPANGSAPLQIGRRSDGATINNLKGQLDEVKFYNRVLTDTEVLQLYYAYDSEEDRVGTLNEGLTFASHFDNGTATDWSANGNNATVIGATATVDKNGQSNSALSFNGSTNSLATNFANYDLSKGFTIHFTLKSTDTSGASILFGQLEEAGAYDKQLVMWSMNPNNNKMNCWVKNTSSYPVLVSNTSFNDNQWHTWTFMYDPGSKQVKLFCDGILEDSASQTLSSFTINQAAHFMATNNRGSIAGQTSGSLDEPRIYTRALTDYEVYQLYMGYDSEDSFQDTLKEGNQLYYSYDNSDLVTDLSGNGNNGTNNGATTGATGILNEAFDFDGSGDKIELLNSTMIGNTWAISTWFKYDIQNNQVLYTFRNDSNNNNVINVEGYLNDELRFVCFNSNGSFIKDYRSQSLNLNTGQFYHLILIWDGSNLIPYINNVEITALTKSTDNTGTMTNTSRTFRLGAQVVNQTSNTWDGIIDETGVWDRPLFDDEIIDLYGDGSAKNPYTSTPVTPEGNKSNALLFGGGL